MTRRSGSWWGSTVADLLVGGLKDEAIARRLGWAVRTMRLRISRLHQELGAASRFQAG